MREPPKCKESVEPAAVATPQRDDYTMTGVVASSTAAAATQPDAGAETEGRDEPADHPTSVNAEQLAARRAPEDNAAVAAFKRLAASSSNVYLYAAIPNLSAMIAENDFSSLDAQKRYRRRLLNLRKNVYVHTGCFR